MVANNLMTKTRRYNVHTLSDNHATNITNWNSFYLGVFNLPESKQKPQSHHNRTFWHYYGANYLV